jgi:hypothetical protein
MLGRQVASFQAQVASFGRMTPAPWGDSLILGRVVDWVAPFQSASGLRLIVLDRFLLWKELPAAAARTAANINISVAGRAASASCHHFPHSNKSDRLGAIGWVALPHPDLQ